MREFWKADAKETRSKNDSKLLLEINLTEPTLTRNKAKKESTEISKLHIKQGVKTTINNY